MQATKRLLYKKNQSKNEKYLGSNKAINLICLNRLFLNLELNHF